ncbi:alternative ribosome rescue aminoacyl-tRNA hydrolase ArfB [Lewinella sp. 4G2]|uniref:alternative ribosome rescue aminoacyl-tRNA hydrolase ArfB n=1 Tax=Lewinella sp. 4G2 TaxID=1803372 RepID=UPI0007B48A9A|nr:alternative ribosome rescue aminoacyl-tRNA hydrolase ArfB [Lewinella sp. 4G2]OAV45537.1 hypothetical protein A3850_014010 [Lewinella sp. 4G2]
MDWPLIQQELTFRTSRSSGAGGQHVNKTETRVELVFNLDESQGLNHREKKNLRHHLKRKIDANGIISVVDQSGRSQHGNKVKALKRLKEMLSLSGRPIPKKHVGKSFVANRGKRLERKKRRSEIKAGRGKIRW